MAVEFPSATGPDAESPSRVPSKLLLISSAGLRRQYTWTVRWHPRWQAKCGVSGSGFPVRKMSWMFPIKCSCQSSLYSYGAHIIISDLAAVVYPYLPIVPDHIVRPFLPTTSTCRCAGEALEKRTQVLNPSLFQVTSPDPGKAMEDVTLSDTTVSEMAGNESLALIVL